MIANDVLSTRGYMALIKSVLNVSNPLVIYVFIDWRMWINLFDVVEACGFGVRNMIVWDKDSPGMGVGWRSQHELILCGMKVTQPFDPHQKAQGNVIRSKRTGNVNHPTEKPVEILETVIHVTDWATTIYDPFLGSGTTLIACERMGRKCRAVEIAPGYVAVALQRWVDLTGGEPELIQREINDG
jgi:DNA modification methylase